MFDEYQLGLYEGKMNERDRIIALLEANAHDGWTRGYLAIGLDKALVLIKGENND